MSHKLFLTILFACFLLAPPASAQPPAAHGADRADRMKRRFQEVGIEMASASQTILLAIPAPAEAVADPAANPLPRRAAG